MPVDLKTEDIEWVSKTKTVRKLATMVSEYGME